MNSKPFGCAKCGLSFEKAKYLVKHIETVHPENPEKEVKKAEKELRGADRSQNK